MKKDIDLINDAIADAEAVHASAIETAKIALVEKFMPKIEEWLDEENKTDTLGESVDLDETKQPTKDGQEKDDYTDDGDDGTPAEGVQKEAADKDSDETNESEDEDDKMDEDVDLNLEEIMAELDEAVNEMEDKYDDDEKNEMEDKDDEKKDESQITLGDLFTEEELAEILGKEAPAKVDEGELTALQVENKELKDNLTEAYDVIRTMRDTINEVNLLNSKLLYTNKLFSAFDLSENAKKSVLAAFDRASTLKEVKLVYTTVGSQLQENGKRKSVKKESTTPRFASDAAGIVNENRDAQPGKVDTAITRMQQLAGLKKAY